MRDKKEIFIPFLYSIQRDINLWKCSFFTAFYTLLKNTLLIYLWVPLFVLLQQGNVFDPVAYGVIGLFVLTFIVLYEVGYLIVDNVFVRFEKREIRRMVYPDEVSVSSILFGVILRLLLILGVFMFFNDLFTWKVVFAYILTFILFFVHGIFSEKYRIGTFLGLRVMKGFAPFSYYIYMCTMPVTILIFIGLMGNAVYYSIEYYFKKLGGVIPIDIFNLKNSLIRIVMIILLSVVGLVIFSLPLNVFLVFLGVIVGHYLFLISLRFLTKGDQKKTFDIIGKVI